MLLLLHMRCACSVQCGYLSQNTGYIVVHTYHHLPYLLQGRICNLDAAESREKAAQ